MIVTFYSYRGGVGRSMSMANVGEILADIGYRVTMCDWDLEAPGLERYLVTNYADDTQYRREMNDFHAWPGIIDLLEEYKQTLSQPPEDQPSRNTKEYARIQSLQVRRPSSYARRIAPTVPRRGSLRLITAGRRDGEALARYAETVRKFDWQDFYDRWAGGAYIDFFRKDLVGEPRERIEGACDLVLIDSRTGVTEQGGVCTHHLADLVIVVTAANDLNMEGAQWMTRALTNERLLKVRGGRPLQVLPIASRIEQTAQINELLEFRQRFQNEFGGEIEKVAGDPKTFAIESEIPYMPFYSFHERVVAREPEDKREQKLYKAYRTLADCIVQYGIKANLLRPQTSQGIFARGDAHGEKTPRGWDVSTILRTLEAAIKSRDPAEIEAFTASLEKDLQSRDESFPSEGALNVLRVLRRHGQHAAGSQLSAAFLQAGVDVPLIRTYGAMAQIALGQVTNALTLLAVELARTKPGSPENLEAHIVTGRAYKQLYLDAKDPTSSRQVRNLERAINEYVEVYRAGPEHVWAGVNAAALLLRATRDQIRLEAAPDPTAIAKEILSVIEKRQTSTQVNQWDALVATEACLVLDRDEEAARWLRIAFDQPDVTPFALESFEAQLTSLWQLDKASPERAALLAVLRAQIVQLGGTAPVRSYDTSSTQDKKFEAVLGRPIFQSLQWMQQGLVRAKSVVRIDDLRGSPVGTGFVLPGRLLHASLGDNGVLITAAHVLGDFAARSGLRASEASVVFAGQAPPALANTPRRISKVYFSSPVEALDVTVAALEPPVTGLDACPIASTPPASDAKVYVIGHPVGGEPSMSAGEMLDGQDALMHYRAPTDAGSSGSPVFNANWELIGLHHRSGMLRRLRGQDGTYSANEAIWIRAILAEGPRRLEITAIREETKAAQSGEPVPNVFISYAHADEALVDELRTHLAILQRRGIVDLHFWDDREIAPGDSWEKSIYSAIERADVFVPLISSDFLASDYAFGKELQMAIQRKMKIVPVVLRASAWKDTPLAAYQVVPNGGKAITSTRDRDAAWLQVVEAIRSAAGVGKAAQAKPDELKGAV